MLMRSHRRPCLWGRVTLESAGRDAGRHNTQP